MADYLTQEEDGTSRFILEEGGGFILLEDTGNKARVSQEPVEVAVLPDDAAARISQEPVDVAVLPSDASARLSQEPVEVVLSPTSGSARLSQEPIEVAVLPTSAAARITQLPVAIVRRANYEQVQIDIIDAMIDA